ncbi:MAG: hypothetical protein UY07_C0035G0007 [Parcubacteria group bacterium GW2011_GWA1_47_8]|nr:MAG: hypothetical protein UY07_C0035G0007 [Parcubacteria group bacterium GW2011_GWA1_47_8]
MLPVGPGPMSSGSDFKDLIEFIIGAFIEPIIYLILGLAVVYFMWNITEVIRKGDNPEELAKLKGKAFWGVVAIAVMVSLWGLVAILTNTFFTDLTPSNPIPFIPAS